MPRTSKTKFSNKQHIGAITKPKDKPTYKLIVLGSGGVAAAALRIPYFETSARTRLNVDEIFFELVRIIRKHKCQYQTNNDVSLTKSKRTSRYCTCTIL
ncbi:unnamed protein product [Rotaria magnacalcarata]|uniref:Uncharacterized protein n=1 Tax=Rotaria magnacalcarata TaxID=392030 RepID=A0A8S2K7V0_9BILA|nr:unnamed protein product [Rotaria magnacalcarata]